MVNKLFQDMSKDEKDDFFLKCQGLLLAYHPDSEFIITKENVQKRIKHIQDLSTQYKGFCCKTDTICALFNKIKIKDINNPIEALRDNMYQPPKEDFNAISIDFVVFRHLNDCLQFCKENYHSKIKYVMYIKDNKPRIYKTENLISKVLGVPISPSIIQQTS